MPQPVNPNASPEARELLGYIYSTYRTVMLSGEHNQMWKMSEPSEKLFEITGRYPLIWGGEWGFSDERHDVDNIKYRPRLLDEIRQHHKAGRIVIISHHQACPVVGEPCGFADGVQMKLKSEQWEEILTVGSDLHQSWLNCVDLLGDAFETLQQERIPIIFRPYHEMNGDWFWWGGQPERFLKLWRMIFDRFVRERGLNNLLWAWNPDKPFPGVEKYFPGLSEVDFLGTDIYPNSDRKVTYPQEWYDRMATLAADKPLALSEMSELPDLNDFESQPWAWFMGWDNLIFQANTDKQLATVLNHPRVISDHR